jgi:chemotaxis protein methyltransferase CheR
VSLRDPQDPAPTLESTLRDLKQALVRHRTILDAQAAREALAAGLPAPLARPLPEVSDGADPVELLAAGVAARTGITVSDSVRDKLRAILAPLPAAAVDKWVERLRDLEGSHPEWLSIIETLTVHETFFFRDRAQMELLRAEVLPRLVAAAHYSGRRALRLWSAGCATGEEPYSLAIMMLEAMFEAGAAIATPSGGLMPAAGWSLSVLGTDIARPVLTRAEQGLYTETPGLSAFRDLPPQYRRWFEEVPRERAGVDPDATLWRVRPELRRIVSFEPHNLVAPPPGRDFDLISCRNVLIYMEAPVRAAIQRRLADSLRGGGFLLFGPTDHPDLTAAFEAVWGDGAVSYRRIEHA